MHLDQRKPIANPVVVLREEFDDWAVLFNPDTAHAVGIDPVGVAIWKQLDGEHTSEQIVDQLENQFSDVPNTAIDHVEKFINTLSEGGFIGFEIEKAG